MAAIGQQLSFANIQKLAPLTVRGGVTLGFNEIGPKVFDIEQTNWQSVNNRPSSWLGVLPNLPP